MHIKIIASESMGTRSMATYIETKDAKIFIDPGVNLAEKRFGLPPHPIEIEQKERDWNEIVRFIEKSEIVIITHYHYDHFNPSSDPEIFRDKFLLIKHPTENINESQKKRAEEFLRKIKRVPTEIIFADGKELFAGETRILFSKPVFHGKDPTLGYVLEVLIDDGNDRFLFTSDVQGPVREDQVEFILENRPRIIFLDGPGTYLMNQRVSKEDIERAFNNITSILQQDYIELVVIDHHFLRDANWKRLLTTYVPSSLSTKIKTAAEYVGKPLRLLEANRRKLWKEY